MKVCLKDLERSLINLRNNGTFDHSTVRLFEKVIENYEAFRKDLLSTLLKNLDSVPLKLTKNLLEELTVEALTLREGEK